MDDERSEIERRLIAEAGHPDDLGEKVSELLSEAAETIGEMRRALTLADQMRQQVAGGPGGLSWRQVWDTIGEALANLK